MAICETNAYHLVALKNIDGIHTIGTWTAISLKTGLLDDTILGCKYNIVAVNKFLVIQILYSQHCIDGIVSLDVEQVLYCPTLRVLGALGNLIALEPVAPTLLGEEQQRVVHCGRIYIFGEVLVTGMGTLTAHSTTALLAELCKSRSLNITKVADGNNHRIIWIEVLCIKLLARILDFGATLVTILLLHLQQFVLHHLFAKLGVVED